MFQQELGPLDGSWTLHNPIGFISQDALQGVLNVGVLLVVVLCAAAPFVRFRRAGGVERQQMKWLFAGARSNTRC